MGTGNIEQETKVRHGSIIVFDEKLEFAIRFYKSNPEDDHWLNFEAVEVCAHYVDNKPFFLNYDTGSGAGDCQDFDVALAENALCTGFIKWDGCMEIHNFTHHFCGFSDFFQRMIKMIYQQGAALIARFEDESLQKFEGK